MCRFRTEFNKLVLCRPQVDKRTLLRIALSPSRRFDMMDYDELVPLLEDVLGECKTYPLVHMPVATVFFAWTSSTRIAVVGRIYSQLKFQRLTFTPVFMTGQYSALLNRSEYFHADTFGFII